MDSIVVSKWINPDAGARSNYACSYILRQNREELFRVDLHMEHGFFEMSEFVAPQNTNNFMIEQISKIGKVRVNVFDKRTGYPMAMMCDNVFKNEDEQRLFELHHMNALSKSLLGQIDDDYAPDDYAAVTPIQTIAATFVHLPKPSEVHAGFFSKVSKWAKTMSDAPKDVLEIQIFEPKICPLRSLCALGVVVHARCGLQLPTVWQDAVRKSG